MAQKKHKPAFEVVALLQETVEVHFSTVKVCARLAIRRSILINSNLCRELPSV